MVPRRLLTARKAAKLTQERLGVLVGIDESTARSRISHYEHGTYRPDFNTACRLARVLDVPTGYLYTPEDDIAVELLAIWQRRKSHES